MDEITGHFGIKRDTIYKWSRLVEDKCRVTKSVAFGNLTREIDEWVRSGGPKDKRRLKDADRQGWKAV